MDHWLVHDDGHGMSDLVRFGLQLPLVLLFLAATSPRYYRRWFVPGIQIAAPIFGLGSVLLAMSASGCICRLVSARLVLVAFFFYFMVGMSFYAALRTNLLVFLSLRRRRSRHGRACGPRDLSSLYTAVRQPVRGRRQLCARARKSSGVSRAALTDRGCATRWAHRAAQSRRIRGSDSSGLGPGGARQDAALRHHDRSRSLQSL